MKPSNVVAIKTTLSGFFSYWVQFTKPLHHLTDRQAQVLEAFLQLRYELSKVISDEDLLDENTMNESSKRKIKKTLNLSDAHFQVIMSELRNHEVIINGKIASKYIPKFPKKDNGEEDGKNNHLMLWFQIDE